MSTTANESEWKEKLKQKRDSAKDKSFGWGQYNQKAQYNSFKKRSEAAKIDVDDYVNKRSETNEEDFYQDSTYLKYGVAPKASDDKLDSMVKELNKQDEKRLNFSRKRKGQGEGQFVDYINFRNKQFNRKIAKAFDSYTTEIKGNLERGTAL